MGDASDNLPGIPGVGPKNGGAADPDVWFSRRTDSPLRRNHGARQRLRSSPRSKSMKRSFAWCASWSRSTKNSTVCRRIVGAVSTDCRSVLLLRLLKSWNLRRCIVDWCPVACGHARICRQRASDRIGDRHQARQSQRPLSHLKSHDRSHGKFGRRTETKRPTQPSFPLTEAIQQAQRGDSDHHG